MTDYAFLEWLRDRLVFVYGESPHADFVLRLNSILRSGATWWPPSRPSSQPPQGYETGV